MTTEDILCKEKPEIVSYQKCKNYSNDIFQQLVFDIPALQTYYVAFVTALDKMYLKQKNKKPQNM